MTLIERIENLAWDVSYRWHKWRADRKASKRKRDMAHDFYQRGVLVLALFVASCGPTTAEANTAHRALYIECTTAWQRIEAMDASADERLRLYEAEGQRCREAGLALCEPTDTCGEFGE